MSSCVRRADTVQEVLISAEDYERMIDSIGDEDFKLYLETLCDTGCRPNEIVKLEKKDIDFEKGTAKIFQTKTKKIKTVYLTDFLLELYKEKSSEYLFLGYNKGTEFYSMSLVLLLFVFWYADRDVYDYIF